MSEKDYKRIRLPEGLKRATIVPKVADRKVSNEDYDKLIEQDFDSNRINYRIVFMYGVPVHIKVEE